MARTVVIDEANAGRRLDVYLRLLLPDVTLGTLMKWIRKGAVRRNGKRAKPEARLAAGDELRLPESEDRPASARRGAEPRPEADTPRQTTAHSGPAVRSRPAARSRVASATTIGAGLAIVYEDADIMVVNKPAGLAVHPGSAHEHDSLLTRILEHLDAHDAAPGHRPGLVQRLDRDVSGLLAVGKSTPILRALGAAAKDGTLEKTYVALVDGEVTSASGTIELALRVTDEPRGDRPRVLVDPRGDAAYTEYTVRERLPGATLLAVRLRTGRMHQIRAHLRALGHPILGDPRYGIAARNLALQQHTDLGRPFLHAGELALPHPRDGRALHFVSPLPSDLARALAYVTHARKRPRALT